MPTEAGSVFFLCRDRTKQVLPGQTPRQTVIQGNLLRRQMQWFIRKLPLIHSRNAEFADLQPVNNIFALPACSRRRLRNHRRCPGLSSHGFDSPRLQFLTINGLRTEGLPAALHFISRTQTFRKRTSCPCSWSLRPPSAGLTLIPPLPPRTR
jgi:hypothetical protein